MNFQTTVSDSLAWVPTDLVFFFVSNRRSDKALPQALGRCFFFAGLTEEGHVMFVKSICIGLMSAVTLLYQQVASAEPAPSDVQVMLVEDGEAVHYRGGLDESAISRVEDLIKNADGRVKRLVIDSAGGEINLGMDLAGQAGSVLQALGRRCACHGDGPATQGRPRVDTVTRRHGVLRHSQRDGICRLWPDPPGVRSRAGREVAAFGGLSELPKVKRWTHVHLSPIEGLKR